ncbi:MAG TPA: response regulator transcription factor [Actinomycetota bacterium]|nr:response regulator transcription factor [Actinomycetota bacterium]
MKLLVVEDEDHLRDLIERAMSEEGYIVEAVGDGDEAAYRLEEFDYDAIVLDWMLPGRSGFDVCKDLREREDWTPVLMLTARDAIEDRVQGLDAGADDYLVKPFSFSELSARIRALTRRGAKPRPVTLEVGTISLDPATRAVQVDGDPATLTPKEFALLEYLMRHPDEVLSRTTLLEHVWDFAYDGASNVVDVYIGYLRKKLDDEGARIESVRGAGYRLKA